MRRAVVIAGVIGALGVAAPMAHAQAPAGGLGNRVQADFLKDRSFIRDGETINYIVAVANNAPRACDASNVTLQFQPPSATGAPSAAFTTLTNAANFPSGTQEMTFGPFAFTATFGPNPPSRYSARLSKASGVVHDVPNPGSPLNIDRELQTITVQPGLSIDKVGSTNGGPAPQNVVYTYSVKNVTLPAGLPHHVSQMRNVVPTDDLCSPLTLISGDTNGDKIMQIAETWTYTCSASFPNPGVFTNTAKVCADETADSIPKNYCSPPDTWTVTVTPSAPQGAVKPQSVAAENCTLKTPSGLKVRKGERTTVKVTVRTVDAGTVARITLPGGKTLS